MFSKLFEPIDIGPVHVENRIQLLPHNTLFDFDTLCDYLARRAKGGAGLIEVSMATAIHDVGEFPRGAVDAWPFKGYDEKVVAFYNRLTARLHAEGSKTFIELSAAGANRGAARAPSSLPGGLDRVTPSQFSPEEIDDLVEAHVRAARYIEAGGFDGLDLHATHGMLLEEFYSKATNKRRDDYGGSLENRTRVLRRIITRIREETGGGLAIGMRIDSDDKFPKGNVLEDELDVAKSLGPYLDFLNVDLGFEHQWMHYGIAPLYEPPGYQLDGTKAFREGLPKRVAIGAAGRITDPVLAEFIVANKIADLVGMTRALIADPDFPMKAREDRVDQIRPCLGDNQKCVANMLRNLPIRCTVNPVVGRELRSGIDSISPAERRLRIAVIGGGVAGMESARVAAERGHSVVLYEGDSKLGGLVNLAAALPGRAHLASIVAWYEKELMRLGVTVRLNKRVARSEDVMGEPAPEVIVVATGSKPFSDGMQSFTLDKIPGSERTLTIDAVLSGASLEENVIILDDTSFIEGLSLAEFLSTRGKRVELVTRDPAPGLKLHWSLQLPYLYERALKSGVIFTPNSFIREIHKDSIVVYNIYTSLTSQRRMEKTTVVLVTGRSPANETGNIFRNTGTRIITVGDCNLAGREMGDVITESFEALRRI